MRCCFWLTVGMLAFGFVGLHSAARAEEAEYQKPEPIPELDWHTDYAVATKAAAANQKMLFIFFHDADMTPARRSFEEKTLRDPAIFEQLGRYELLTQPLDATVQINNKKIKLLDHPSFREMHGRQGVAIIDFQHKNPEYYGYVVSTFPFTSGKYYVPISLSLVLDLPPGTLTQRTMIYAVRLHPEKPRSTEGQLNPVLVSEASQHSNHQANILVQGHHNWDTRFQRISAKLPGGGTAQEVVAESWPNETLVEACVDCVDSWRQSPGHWGAVRSAHPFFGYDIKLGRNGIWYATGIFGRR